MKRLSATGLTVASFFDIVAQLVSEALEQAGMRVHDVAVDADILGHERVIAYQVHSFGYGFGGVGESVEPAVEVYTAVAHERDVFLVDSARTHEVEHLLGIHSLDAAAGMSYDHDFVDAEFVDGDEQRAHCRVKGVCDGATCVFDHLYIAVLYAERCGEEFDEAGVHAGDDCNAFVGVFRGLKPTVAFRGHEFAVIFKDFVYHDV